MAVKEKSFDDTSFDYLTDKAKKKPSAPKTVSRMPKGTSTDKGSQLAEYKQQIRDNNPSLSEATVESRARKAAGLPNPTTPAEAERILDAPKNQRSLPSVRVPMNTSKAQRIIFGVMLGVTGLTILGDITSGKASVSDSIPRRMVAGTLAGIMLMLLAVPAPKLAASLAGVTAVAVLFVNPSGATIIAKLSGSAKEIKVDPAFAKLDAGRHAATGQGNKT